MADDGDIDIEGEFDFKLEAGDGFYDVNELPSKSANLLPEYTNPPWMLEQGWTLDMDEKSKATIEKMLLEEQQYLNGKTRSKQTSMVDKGNRRLSPLKTKPLPPKIPPSASPSKSNCTSKKSKRHKGGWTMEEKTLFLKGLDIFGRSWTKISDLIPSRSSLQVKNYAQQYFKNLTKDKDHSDSEIDRLTTDCLLSSLETGQPTIRSVMSTTICQKNKLNLSSPRSTSSQKSHQMFTSLNSKTTIKTENISVNILNNSTTFTTDNSALSSTNQNLKLPKVFCTDSAVLDNVNSNNIVFKTEIPNSLLSTMLISNADVYSLSQTVNQKYCGDEQNEPSSLSDASSSMTPEKVKTEFKQNKSDDDDEDDDIDIDIENEDDGENPILLSRSTSPTSVYQKLLQSARINMAELRDSDEETTTLELEDQEDQCSISSQKTSKSDILDFQLKSEETSNCSSDQNSLPNAYSVEENFETKITVLKNLVNGVISSSGELVEFPIPTTSVQLNFDEISEEEQTVHSEFFDGRLSKTPDRYLKIRNHIIETWLKCKPVYLNKTSVRKGLKNCGDVNCIGRIHSYLECIGVINFNCEQAVYNNLNKTQFINIKTNDIVPAVCPVDKSDASRCRKRRIRDAAGDWVDIKEFEGKTIEHKDIYEDDSKPKGVKSFKFHYDPFQLVPCQPFTDNNKAPFQVDVSNLALIVMDVHAHISKTEVIGMLGGRYLAECGKLEIKMAVPCVSLSTGMQCEMDPVSQTIASEEISNNDLQVVGWYHSHPTFSPNPSIRDIETQIKFQEWFSKLGGCQFIGIIVSPYNRLNTTNISQINCLTIGQQVCPQLNCNIPHQFDYKVIYSICNSDIVTSLQTLAEQYTHCNNPVILSGLYKQSSGLTCLQKMLESIKPYLEEISDNKKDIINTISNMFQDKTSLVCDVEIINIENDAKSSLYANTSLLQETESKSCLDANSPLLQETQSKSILDANTSFLPETQSKSTLDANVPLLPETQSKSTLDANVPLLPETQSKSTLDANTPLVTETQSKSSLVANTPLLLETQSTL